MDELGRETGAATRREGATTVLRSRIDAGLLPGLDAFHAAGGPRDRDDPATPVQQRERFNAMMARGAARRETDLSVIAQDAHAPGPRGAPDVPVRVYRPADAAGALPALLYIHGGGMIVGSLDSEDAVTRLLCARLGCCAVSVDYRLAPENPHPAPVEDCYAALRWAVDRADELGIDASRVAVYGGSAGGGLAAATALLARDRGGPALCFQMLAYPMLDDRCTHPSVAEVDDVGIFDGWAHRGGWHALLGDRRGTDDVDAYAAPSRAADLSGLPPAWIDVGEVDALRDEDVLYALALLRAGVAAELHVYPGAFHAAELFGAGSPLAQRIVDDRVAALRRAFGAA